MHIDIYIINKVKIQSEMGYIYDYDFYDDVVFIPKSCCGGGGRSEEQIKIDDEQNAEIKAEVERSTGVDDKQSQEIETINDKIKELDKPPYYETDEE